MGRPYPACAGVADPRGTRLLRPRRARARQGMGRRLTKRQPPNSAVNCGGLEDMHRDAVRGTVSVILANTWLTEAARTPTITNRLVSVTVTPSSCLGNCGHRVLALDY